MVLIAKNIPNWYGCLMFGTVHITLVLFSEYSHIWDIVIKTHLHCSPQYLFHSRLNMKCLVDPILWSELVGWIVLRFSFAYIWCQPSWSEWWQLLLYFYSLKFSKDILNFTKVYLMFISKKNWRVFFFLGFTNIFKINVFKWFIFFFVPQFNLSI